MRKGEPKGAGGRRAIEVARRLIIPLLITAALSVTAGAYSVARILEKARPDVALSIMPSLPPALVAKADAAMVASERGPGQMANGRAFAERALKSAPLNPDALRTLALVSSDDTDRALKLLTTAHGLSRRDIGTQVVMIELAAARGDVSGALRHYDQALRVKPSVGSTLYPVLLSAADDPSLLPAIRNVVAKGPSWLPHMTGWALENPKYLPPLTALVEAFPLGSNAMSQDYGHPMIDELVKQRRYRDAYVVYGAYRKAMLRTPKSEHRPFRPFDWAPADNFETGSDAVPGQPASFEIFAESASRGEVMSKLNHLPGGKYSISFGVDPIDAGGQLQTAIFCAGTKEDNSLFVSNVPLSAGTFRREFTVPQSGCLFQWVRLLVQAGEGPVRARLKDISLTRVP